MKKDNNFYDEDLKLREILESMKTYPFLSEAMETIYDEIQSSQDTVSALKKRIKYSKNPLEKKFREKN